MAVQPQQSGGSDLSQLSVGEMLAGIIVFAPLVAAVPLLVERVRMTVWSWLVDHHIVVTTQTLTIFEGQGLDVSRIFIALSAAVLALAVGYATVRRRQQLRLGGRR